MNNFPLKYRLVWISLFALALTGGSLANAAALGWTKSFLLGYGATRANQTQTVRLANTPAPGLTNHYVGSGFFYGAALIGFALEKQVATRVANTVAALGIEADYLRNNAVNGVVEPQYNISPNFDELKYAYDIHSVVLQATAKLTKQTLFNKLGGYVQAGIGAAVNRLSDYREYTPEDSSAAPMLSPFGNRDTFNPALSAGAGITYPLGEEARLSFGFRYFYTGRGRLAKSPVQQTNASIVLSPIRYPFLMIQLTG